MITRNWFVFVDGDMISCNFETSCIFGYTQDINDTFDWTRHSGNTTTSSTGPRFDHTLGNALGHYMYTESSSPRKHGDVARLISPTAHANRGTYSVGFYYSMHGSTMGTLNVYVDIGAGQRSPAFSLTGDQGTSWQYGCVDIPPDSTFKVVFESIIGVSYFSDIAIDDVTLQTGTCSSLESTKPSGGSNCKDTSLCPDLITSVPNLCSSFLALQCNGSCLCNGHIAPTVSSTLKPTTTPIGTHTTTAVPQTTTIYRFPNGSKCNDEPACDYMSKIPNFCSNAELMVYCYKTCGLCGVYASGSGSVGGGVVVPDHCAQHACVHGRCVSNTQSYTCSCDIGFIGALCDHHDPCHSQPCIHGQCEVLTSTGGYQCKCDLGFSGTACDISLVRDCQDVLDYNVKSFTHDDIYLIDITETFMDAKKLNVKCEFNDNKGWTVIMNRNSGQLNFDDKYSAAYATGFGSARGEFWMGLEYMHFMTSDGRRYQLRIDFTLANGSHYYQVYTDFSVGPHTKFALSYGNAGDSLSGHNTFGFTTKDRDQDSNSRVNCASYLSGGWWFHDCADSCLTCNYVTPGTYDCRSMAWNALGYCVGLKAVSMKIRPM